jgi:transposase
LTPDQERDIQHCLIDKTPDQFRLSFALWTRLAVGELIELRTGVRLPVRTVGLYLERWGFTPQKPLKRAYEQRPAAVAKWLEEEYPAIAQRAAEEKAEIHWGDETGLRSDAQHGRSYSPKGKTPEIRLSAKRTSVSLISTVTNQGKVRFMFLKQAMNADLLITFFKRLCRDAGRKVFLILDNLPAHHARIVKAWLKEHANEIEVFYLPSYSPELNPDEYLNGALKADVHSRPPMRSEGELTRSVMSYMRYLQKTPYIVAQFFRHPKVAYAQ